VNYNSDTKQKYLAVTHQNGFGAHYQRLCGLIWCFMSLIY